MDKNIYELPPEDLKKIPQVPSSLGEALDLLEKDHEFLLEGRRLHRRLFGNVDRGQAQRGGRPAPAPHPYEFHLYYDV